MLNSNSKAQIIPNKIRSSNTKNFGILDFIIDLE